MIVMTNRQFRSMDFGVIIGGLRAMNFLPNLVKSHSSTLCSISDHRLTVPKAENQVFVLNEPY